jgi:hypothetical protein
MQESVIQSSLIKTLRTTILNKQPGLMQTVASRLPTDASYLAAEPATPIKIGSEARRSRALESEGRTGVSTKKPSKTRKRAKSVKARSSQEISGRSQTDIAVECRHCGRINYVNPGDPLSNICVLALRPASYLNGRSKMQNLPVHPSYRYRMRPMYLLSQEKPEMQLNFAPMRNLRKHLKRIKRNHRKTNAVLEFLKEMGKQAILFGAAAGQTTTKKERIVYGRNKKARGDGRQESRQKT